MSSSGKTIVKKEQVSPPEKSSSYLTTAPATLFAASAGKKLAIECSTQASDLTEKKAKPLVNNKSVNPPDSKKVKQLKKLSYAASYDSGDHGSGSQSYLSVNDISIGPLQATEDATDNQDDDSPSLVGMFSRHAKK